MELNRKENRLLITAIFFYVLMLLYLKYNTVDNISICNIMKNKGKYVIIALLLLFSYFILEYEKKRKDNKSYYCLVLLVISIFGLIIFLENNLYHSIIAKIIFILILLFMIWHFIKTKNKILGLILLIELVIAVILEIKKRDNILIHEILFLLLFAAYYFYLHYLDYFTHI